MDLSADIRWQTGISDGGVSVPVLRNPTPSGFALTAKNTSEDLDLHLIPSSLSALARRAKTSPQRRLACLHNSDLFGLSVAFLRLQMQTSDHHYA